MAIETFAEYGEPDRELTDPVPRPRGRALQADAVPRTCTEWAAALDHALHAIFPAD
jgi:hypothetical protein